MGSLFRKAEKQAPPPPRKSKPVDVTRSISSAIVCGNEHEISLDYQPTSPWYRGTFRLGTTPLPVDPPLANNSAIIEAMVRYIQKNKPIKIWRRGKVYSGRFSQEVPHLDLTVKIEYDHTRQTLRLEEVVDSHAWQGDR